MRTKKKSVTKRAVYAGVLVFLVYVASPLVIVFAQTANGNHAPAATSVSRSQSTSSSPASVAPSYVPDPNADQYKLIFASGYKGKDPRAKKPDDDDDEGLTNEFVQTTTSKLDNFVEQINQAGALGYKLVSALAGYGEVLVGIFKLDGTEYEYRWLMTDTEYALDGNANYERLSTGGFRLVNHFKLNVYCYGATDYGSDGCKTKFVSLLEKRKGAVPRTSYAFLWHASPSGLTNDLQEKLAEGFVPSYLFEGYQMLVERPEGKDRFNDKPDVRAITGSRVWGKGEPSKKKINELAKQGYRLAWLNDAIALMQKDGVTATPVTYVWLHATTHKNWKLVPRKRTDFEKKLANLQASGAAYRLTYRDDQGHNDLIFEQKAVDDGKRREYKVLTFDFQVDVDAASHQVSVELNTESKEMLKLLESLAKDGFVVRDLFYSSGYNIVLERTPS